jgi:hypothetical protein
METGATMRFILQQIGGQTTVTKPQLAGAPQAASRFCPLPCSISQKATRQERECSTAGKKADVRCGGIVAPAVRFHAPHSDIRFTQFHGRPGHGLN